jgi:hypothetical protein
MVERTGTQEKPQELTQERLQTRFDLRMSPIINDLPRFVDHGVISQEEADVLRSIVSKDQMQGDQKNNGRTVHKPTRIDLQPSYENETNGRHKS